MANELARQMSSEALRDFNQIDTDHKGYLNLVDIARYEQKGPEQKKVARFLEDNFGAIHMPLPYPRNDAENRQSLNTPGGAINRVDLDILNEFSDPARAGQLKKDETNITHEGEVVGGLAGALFGEVPAMGLGVITACMATPAGGALAFGGFMAAATAVTSLGFHFQTKDDLHKEQQTVDTMKL